MEIKKVGRPKGSKQQRNESKYWLPSGVSLKPNQTVDYNKETKLIFIDEIYGEFISTFKAIQGANASTHPESVKQRRFNTNVVKFGGPNPSCSKEVRQKAKNTMIKRYNVEHALLNSEFAQKSKDTLLKNYGVEYPGQSKLIMEKVKKTNISRYGSENPMGNIQVQQKQFYSSMENNPDSYKSKGEKEVRDFIQSLGLQTKTRFIYDEEAKEKKQLDIFIPELNVAIEYNGDYWHSEANKKIYNNYHRDKMLLCKKLGVRLIQIFEHKWQQRKEQIKSFLQSAVGKNQIVIYARKCDIREVPQNDADSFLDKYHILGRRTSERCIGLYYNNELVSLATFGKHHRQNSNDIQLSRFITKTNVNVIGGLSRITKRALEEYGEIITFIDLCWSTGENWIKNGWTLEKELSPDYYYYNNSGPVSSRIIPKQSRRKKVVNTPEGMTEHEHALSQKLFRVYDCGKLRLRIKK